MLLACGIAERHVAESDVGGGGGVSLGGRNMGGHAFATGGVSTGPGAGFGNGGALMLGTGGTGKGGAATVPFGGKSFGGMPPIATTDCSEIPSVAPVVCGPGVSAGGDSSAAGVVGGGDAGAGGFSGVSAGAGGAEAGAGGATPGWCVPDAGAGIAPGLVDRRPVDDLEDGDDATPFLLNGRGSWFAVNDGSGQQFPLPCTLPSELPVARDGSHFAMRSYGQGFLSAPGGYSLVGIAVKSGAGCDQPLDAAAFTGVEFWVRGSGFMRFFIGTVETNPTVDFGTCSAGCYDSHGAFFVVTNTWQLVRIPFVSLVQEGWGAPASFNPAHILTLEWSAKTSPFGGLPASCFDFWVDDVAFYR